MPFPSVNVFCVVIKSNFNIISEIDNWLQPKNGNLPFNLKVVDENFGEMTKSVYKIDE